MLTSLSAGMSRRRWARTAKLGARELPLPPRHTAGLRTSSWLTRPKGSWWHGQLRWGGPGGHRPWGAGLGCNPLKVYFYFIWLLFHSPTSRGGSRARDVAAGPRPSGRGLAQTPAPGAPSTQLPFLSQPPAEPRPSCPLLSPDRYYILYLQNYLHFHLHRLPDLGAWRRWGFGGARRCHAVLVRSEQHGGKRGAESEPGPNPAP